MSDWLQQISREVTQWPQVTAGPHRFGGTEFHFGAAEIGHIHRDGTLDIPFPVPVRNPLISDGLAEKHPFLPDSGWVTFHANDTNFDRALCLLRLSYLRYALKQASRTHGPNGAETKSVLRDLKRTAASELFATMAKLPAMAESAEPKAPVPALLRVS